jgi:hypothetical protein
VVEGDGFRRDPEGVLRAYCDTVDVTFDTAMLRWSDGRIRAWGADEADSQAKWHRTLEASSGVLPPGGHDDIAVPAERLDLYHRALEIYELLAAGALGRELHPTAQ